MLHYISVIGGLMHDFATHLLFWQVGDTLTVEVDAGT